MSPIPEEFAQLFNVLTTQLEQTIDIQMMILKNLNEKEADFVDYVHNDRNVFLSKLSHDEYVEVMSDYQRHLLSESKKDEA